ncbi:MAG TPA: TlpA disulfide reductase family protein [Chitinophagaceae bacterium]|jgi:thiol-disulfide isomerase/thioredoxin|nr:TlpA disulfide reductase family protein [Chitinophagaceae bacterium]
MKFLKTFFLVFCITVISISAKSQTPNITDSRLDFTLPDMKGDSLRLSSMKGKVFLLDFWASWCGPCRYSNKNLIKLYSKYKQNGFEILSVSLDDSKKEWVKAVNKDKITWLQINDSRGWDARSATKWQVDAIPASFLIDKNGDVVAINAERKELENKIRELLGL